MWCIAWWEVFRVRRAAITGRTSWSIAWLVNGLSEYWNGRSISSFTFSVRGRSNISRHPLHCICSSRMWMPYHIFVPQWGHLVYMPRCTIFIPTSFARIWRQALFSTCANSDLPLTVEKMSLNVFGTRWFWGKTSKFAMICCKSSTESDCKPNLCIISLASFVVALSVKKSRISRAMRERNTCTFSCSKPPAIPTKPSA